MPVLLGQNDDADCIVLQTRLGNRIRNCRMEQVPLTPFEEGIIQSWPKSYPSSQKRTAPLGHYNCHGLAFGSRRTWIPGIEDFEMMLRDDGYKEVQVGDILPGDIILYFDSDGILEHSGVIASVSPSNPGILRVPWVVSKWSKFPEFFHPANQCPYNFSNAKYFRVCR